MMQNMLVNIDMDHQYRDALMEIGYKLEDLYEQETDAALGNGGLGRLAACFLDSLATLEIPAWGYGIRYDFGIFKQEIKDGKQVEIPDFWLKKGNPWEIERSDVVYQVRFGGISREYEDNGTRRANWDGGQVVIA
jgi:starch phosphorylase